RADAARAEGGQGPGRRRAQARAREREQGRRREGGGAAQGSGGDRRAQVASGRKRGLESRVLEPGSRLSWRLKPDGRHMRGVQTYPLWWGDSVGVNSFGEDSDSAFACLARA